MRRVVVLPHPLGPNNAHDFTVVHVERQILHSRLSGSGYVLCKPLRRMATFGWTMFGESTAGVSGRFLIIECHT